MNIYYSLYPLPLFFPLSLKNFLSSSASLSLNLLTFIFTSFYKTHSSSLSIKCVSFLSNIIFSHPLFYFNTHFSLSLFLSLSTIHFSIPLLHLFLSNILLSSQNLSYRLTAVTHSFSIGQLLTEKGKLRKP